MVEFLLRHTGIDVNQKDDEGWTLLHELAKTHRVGMAVHVLRLPNARLSAASASGDTPLHLAIEHHQIAMAQLLLEHGADIHQLKHGGWTLLHVACAKGHLKAVTWLLDRTEIRERNGRHIALAAVLNASLASGDTPLLLAAAAGHRDVVDHLLQQEGIDPAQSDQQEHSALHKAVLGNHIETTTLLLDRGAVPVDATTHNGVTPLLMAIENRHLELANLLLSRGAHINRHRSDGCTPLHITCARNDCDSVWWLLQRDGILPNKANTEGMAPLHTAALSGHFSVVELLLEHARIDVFQRGPDGYTLLHFAVAGPKPAQVLAVIGRMLSPEDFRKLAGMVDRWDTHAASLAAELGCDQKLVLQLALAPRTKPVPWQPPRHLRMWCVTAKGTVGDKARSPAEIGRTAGLQTKAFGDGTQDLSLTGLKQLDMRGGDVVVFQLPDFVDKALGRRMLRLGAGEVAPMTAVARVVLEKGVLRALFVGIKITDGDASMLPWFKNDPFLRRPVDDQGGLPGLAYTFVDNAPPHATASSPNAVALWLQDGAAQARNAPAGQALRKGTAQPMVTVGWNAAQKALTMESFVPSVTPVAAPVRRQQPRLKETSS